MKLDLPQLTAELSSPVFCTKNSCPTLVLVAGGRPPHTDWLREAVDRAAAIWAIDRGIDALHKAELLPNRLIGDGDSAADSSWQWAEQQGVPVNRFAPAKDLTDLQLALRLSRPDFDQSFVIVTGAFGGRLDHAMSLLYSLVGDGRPGCLADEQEVLLLLRSEESVEVTLSEEYIGRLPTISLLPLSPICSGVTISGVRWPLDKAELTQQLPYAISNEPLPEAKKISVSLADGVLGLYMMFGDLMA